MSAKLDRLGAECERLRKKRNDAEAQLQAAEKRYVELEKEEIHEMVHAANLNPEQLAEIIRLAKERLPDPGNLPVNETEEPPEWEVSPENEGM